MSLYVFLYVSVHVSLHHMQRTSSSDMAMYLVNKLDLVKNVRCGDGFTVSAHTILRVFLYVP